MKPHQIIGKYLEYNSKVISVIQLKSLLGVRMGWSFVGHPRLGMYTMCLYRVSLNTSFPGLNIVVSVDVLTVVHLMGGGWEYAILETRETKKPFTPCKLMHAP